MRGHAASIVADGEPCSAQQGSSVSAFAPGVFEAADHCSSYSAPLPSMATESTWRGTRDTARSGSAMSHRPLATRITHTAPPFASHAQPTCYSTRVTHTAPPFASHG